MSDKSEPTITVGSVLRGIFIWLPGLILLTLLHWTYYVLYYLHEVAHVIVSPLPTVIQIVLIGVICIIHQAYILLLLGIARFVLRRTRRFACEKTHEE